jgi:hypothetical protein
MYMYIQQGEYAHQPVVLVGCESGSSGRRQVSYHDVRQFADERNIPVIEVRGKEGVNVELAFMTLVGEILYTNSCQ